MFNNIAIFFRKMLRQPMPIELLVEFSSQWLAAPPIPKEVQNHYHTAATDDGTTLLAIWREEFVKNLKEIAGEPAWTLQKKLLLRHLVRESDWVAIFESVNKNDSISSWGDFVAGVDMFESIEDKERYYYARLQQRYLLALPTIGALGVIGMTAYGLNEAGSRSIRFYKERRKRFISMVVGVWREALSLKEGGGVPEEVAKSYTKIISKIWQLEGEYSKSLAEKVINETVDFHALQGELTALDDKKKSILDNLVYEKQQP